MAKYFAEESRTFSEYLLVPNLTTEKNTPNQVDLSTPICKYKKGQEESKLKINIPMVSAVMQAVSDDGLAIALARCGGLSFIFQSQSVENQCEMIRKVKKYKAGIVASDSKTRRDGREIETIGTYDPTKNPAIVKIDEEKAIKWLKDGAVATDTVRSILSKNGTIKKFSETK